ncbi:MAG TPA: ferrochelatase [Rhodanobacteraceae bacterium]|nr:ferrochelatase [Rhodanobacteraceae bacterium]
MSDASATTKTGVLVVNLGTPDAPTAAALRRYLGEFLADPRVVDLTPRWWWWLILHAVILTVRPARSAAAYRKVWTAEGSPLRVHTEELVDALRSHLAMTDATVMVELAMRYGAPSIASALERMRDADVRRLRVLPLYPQYSRTTTASVDDAVDAALATLGWAPECVRVPDYHLDEAWLDALAASVQTYWQAHGRGEVLLLSFHGIPQRYVAAGDPYYAQCRASADALGAKLGLIAGEVVLCFQSRVGREPWLEPYTDHTVKALAAAGIKRIDAVCPGFAVDCLETLEEVALRYAEAFRAAGGEELRYIPALNASAAHVAALAGLIARLD